MLAATVVLGMTAGQPVQSLDNGIDIALGRAGITRTDAQFDASLMGFYRQGDFASPFYEAALSNVWRTPQLLGVLRNEIALGSSDTFKVVSILSRLTPNGSRRDLLGNPAAGSIAASRQPGYLEIVLGQMLDRGIITEDWPTLSSVPGDVQAAAALVLDVALQSHAFDQAAFQNVPDRDAMLRRELGTTSLPSNPVEYRELTDGYRQVDLAYLYAAGQDLTAAVEFAGTSLASAAKTATFNWRLTTAWGDIILSGAGDQQYVDPKALLIIDLAGDDTYVNCPTQKSASQWLSVVIDADGNDRYLSESTSADVRINQNDSRSSQRSLPGPGSAYLGCTLLFDAAGNDLYRSARSAFGSATLGVAVQIDRAGDDLYDSYADSIGYGKFGIGLLVDSAGSDIYRGFTQTMGVGMTGGVGMILDQVGDDEYLAETQALDFPSPQDPEQNVSMSMGAGNGFRMDYINGRSLAGGVGILMDVRGSDLYESAVFGQGVGYWMGVGALFDLGGNDEYNGVWYVQGSAAHFAVGALIDTDGGDTYSATTNMSHGAGHDFSFGYFLDDRGDDNYSAGNLAFGAGNANGIGFFADMEGTDSYQAAGNTVLGRSNAAQEGSLRTRAFALGLFLDGYGNDTFPDRTPWARNGNGDVNIAKPAPTKSETQYGIFLDR